MKKKTIFALLQMYINKEPMPKRIKYELMEEGYKYFRWEDYDCFEYVNEGDETCFLSDTPWHHYMDEVEIVDEPRTVPLYPMKKGEE